MTNAVFCASVLFSPTWLVASLLSYPQLRQPDYAI
jgi:hypothetical protein